MSNSMTFTQWIVTLIATGVLPIGGVLLLMAMEYVYKKPTPKKKQKRRRR